MENKQLRIVFFLWTQIIAYELRGNTFFRVIFLRFDKRFYMSIFPL